MENLKVAIVYDWLDKWGGAERLLLVLKELFPQAVFYTSYRDREKTKWLEKSKVKESFVSSLPSFIKKSRLLSLPFYPFAFESFDFSNFDLVISLTAYFAKAVITKPKTFHVSYILTPPRFLYYDQGEYLNPVLKKLLKPYLSYLKKWDFIAAQRADLVLSVSKEVQERVKKVYDRDSKVVYPPFDIDHWKNVKKNLTKKTNTKKFERFLKNKFFLFVGRLEPYKKIDLFIELAKLYPEFYFVVVGKGSKEKSLKRRAAFNVVFLKNLSDEELGFLYSKAEALIVPQKEEFGYVAAESLYFGLPIIYFEKGGVKEIVGNLGISFKEQKLEVLRKAIEKYLTLSYNLKKKVKAEGKMVLKKFSKQNFKKEFVSLIRQSLK